MNVPQLRFSGFDGEWEENTLGKLGNFTKGMALSKADISEEGDPCILYGELYTKYGPVINHVHSRTNSNNKRVFGKKNDVLIPSSGETAIDIACASGLETENVLLGGDLNIFRPKENVSGVFLSYQINGVRKFELSKLAQGASVVHLYSSNLKRVKVMLPDFTEQVKIASYFKLLHKRIETQNEKVELLKKQKKTFIHNIFNKKIRFKDENGDNYSEWIKHVFIELFNSIPTSRYQIQNIEIQKAGLYEVVDQGKSEIAGFCNESAKLFTDVPVIIFGDHTTNLKLRKTPFIVGADGTKILKAQANNSLNYLYQALSFYNVKSEGYKRHFSILKAIELPLPCIEEQEKIGEFLSVVDHKIDKEQKKLDKYKELKKIFMQKMFV